MMQTLMLIILLLLCQANCQNDNIYPITLNEQFPEITLKSATGEQVVLPGSGD